jgi:all-trans-retinol dehydrogenase (NAD+)
MSSALNVRNIVGGSSKIALNPFVTASLLWVLTRGPSSIRDRVFEIVISLRNPRTLAQVVKALKWLLAIGVLGTTNRTLNELALNSWRTKSEKSRWQ